MLHYPDISAGPYFDCEAGWDPTSAGCVSASCGGGQGAKVTAELKYCANSDLNKDGTLELEVKICVDVISDVIAEIGKHISEVESFMNSKTDS